MEAPDPFPKWKKEAGILQEFNSLASMTQKLFSVLTPTVKLVSLVIYPSANHA